jgi:hypothetical protein
MFSSFDFDRLIDVPVIRQTVWADRPLFGVVFRYVANRQLDQQFDLIWSHPKASNTKCRFCVGRHSKQEKDERGKSKFLLGMRGSVRPLSDFDFRNLKLCT